MINYACKRRDRGLDRFLTCFHSLRSLSIISANFILLSSLAFVMDAVNEAMKALKQVALKGKKDKGLAERVDSLTTTLRLLVLLSNKIPRKWPLYQSQSIGYLSQC